MGFWDDLFRKWRKNLEPKPDPKPKHPAPPSWFCPERYLAKYKDVAASIYYSQWPYEHYLNHGKAEGRDPCPSLGRKPDPKPAPNPPPGEHKVLMELKGRSCFALCILKDGRILMGDYSIQDKTPYLYQVGKGKVAEFRKAGESVFSIIQAGNTVIITTEDKGKVYKAGIYSLKNPEKKMTLEGGVYGGAFGAFRAKGEIVVVGGGETRVWGRNSGFKFSKNYYVKNGCEFRGKAYVFGYSKKANSAGYFVSSDLVKWRWKNVIKRARFMGASVSPDGKKVVISGSSNYSGMKHHDDSAASFIMDKNGVRLKAKYPGYQYASCSLDGYIGLTRGWRSDEPGARIATLGGDTVAEFPEAELRAIERQGDSLITATRTDKVRGRVYQVDLKGSSPKPPKKKTKEMGDLHPRKRTNGKRLTWYFNKKMREYPEEFEAVIPGWKKIVVKNNGKRFERPDFLAKQSDVKGRGLVILAHKSCTVETCYIEY